MKPDEIYEHIRGLRAAGRSVVYDPVPAYDQSTQYVYEASISETAGQATVHLAVGQLPPPVAMTFPMPGADVAPIPAPIPTVAITAEDGTVI